MIICLSHLFNNFGVRMRKPKKEKIRRQKPLPPPPANSWQAFEIRFQKLDALCNEIILANNAHKKNFTIDDVKEALDNLVDIEKLLPNYENKYLEYKEKLTTDEEKEKLNMLWEGIPVKSIMHVIQLCKILANKHMAYINPKHEKTNKMNAEQALFYATKALIYRTTFIPPEMDYEKDLEKFKNDTRIMFEKYQPAQNIDNEFEVLLHEARSTKDKDKAYGLYTEAANLALQAKSPVLQFHILLEQADFWMNNSHKYVFSSKKIPLADIDKYKIYTDKVTKPLMIIADLKISDQLINDQFSKELCIVDTQLFTLAYNLNQLSLSPALERHLDKKIAILKDANEYLNVSILLGKKIKHEPNIKEASALQEEVIKKLTQLQLQKDEEIIKQQLKESAAAIKEQEIEKFDENFEEILKDFPDALPNKPVKIQAPVIEYDDSSSTSEKVETAEKNNKSIPLPAYFDLNEHLQLLNVAQHTNNIKEQIFCNTKIGEHYQLQAKYYLKRHDYNDSIYLLQSTIQYFTVAHQLLCLSNKDEHIQIKSCLTMCLEYTENLIIKTLKKQENIKQRFEIGRQEAKAKMGDAWYKQNDSDFTLSLNAKIRMNAEKNVKLLAEIHKEFKNIFKNEIQNNEATTSVISHSMFQPENKESNKKVADIYSTNTINR